jgi:hemolysin activation/secretion protein
MRTTYFSYSIAFLLCFILSTTSLCNGAGYTGIAAINGIRLSAVLLEGSRVIPDNVRDMVVSPYLYKQITFVELELIRNELTMWLVDNGFINSGVVIPDQDVNNGVIKMQVIDGIVTSINISGTSSFSADYFRSRLGIATASPFNISHLRDTLQLFQQDPQVRSINADLSAGAKPGESTLSVKVSEARPWSLYISSSNDNSPATGPYRGETGLSYRNAIGYGDLISARFGGTEGGYDVSTSASIPVTPYDTLMEAFYRRSEYGVIDPLYKKLDIRSESETIGAKISHPFLKSTRREVRPSLTFERRESRNYLLGQGFSFSQKEADGFSVLNAGRFGIEWIERGASSVMLVSTTASFSTDSAEFLSWSSRLIWMQRTGWRDTRFLVRADTQIANDSLPPMEKFALGGMNSVRGFRKNVLVRDNALGGSFEYFLPLLSDNQETELFAISAFFDYGRGWDIAQSKLSISDQQVAGAGMGLKISWMGGTADISYAFPVIKPDNHRTEDMQDRGFHFLVSWSL